METTIERSRSSSSGFADRFQRMNPDRIYAFLMILPSIILLGIFVYGFIGQTFAWSLTDWEGLSADQDKNYIGLENYERLFSDFDGFRFRQEMVNTFFFTLFFLSGCLVLGFLLAVALDQNVRGEGLFRTIFLFPMALSFAVTGTVWRWLLNPRGGINLLPEIVGADAWNFRWLNDRSAYQFNWHDVPLLSLLLIIFLLLFVFFQYVLRRKFLQSVFFGVPMLIFLAWIWRDFLTYNAEDPRLHGKFDWMDVPQYVTAFILIGFLLYLVNMLWKGQRRTALIAAIPTGIILAWYASGGPGRFPNVQFAGTDVFGFNNALIGVILASVWQLSGYTMAMYLAGIRGVAEELREAARVDGCTEWQVYTRIILPLLRPITLSAAIVLGHISLKVFDLIFAMAGTDYLPVSVPGVQVYTRMFRGNQFAVGSAIAIILLIMVAVVIIPYLATQLRGEHEV